MECNPRNSGIDHPFATKFQIYAVILPNTVYGDSFGKVWDEITPGSNHWRFSFGRVTPPCPLNGRNEKTASNSCLQNFRHTFFALCTLSPTTERSSDFRSIRHLDRTCRAQKTRSIKQFPLHYTRLTARNGPGGGGNAAMDSGRDVSSLSWPHYSFFLAIFLNFNFFSLFLSSCLPPGASNDSIRTHKHGPWPQQINFKLSNGLEI